MWHGVRRACVCVPAGVCVCVCLPPSMCLYQIISRGIRGKLYCVERVALKYRAAGNPQSPIRKISMLLWHAIVVFFTVKLTLMVMTVGH